MHRTPVISGEKAVKCFEKLGYEITRQKGSHIRLHHRVDKDKKPLTIPRHKELGKGLLRKLVRDADISIEDLVGLL
ncbi:MAG: type II toxin-antitoxin system HicA family toxin [Candidatus Margulisbacteria bacterium]|nr:type II toxin-antitoxin system HicA family toxin [Candidatus Margulisiibacteriota bacterium]MBU1616171.1 type II toxin-antitoxin system HicA family toxin [Candidatus Margulisiibacteriota bacterium]